MFTKIIKMSAVTLLSAAMLGSTAYGQVATITDPAMSERIQFAGRGGPVSGELSVVQSQSQVLQFDTNIGHSLISDPEIADIIPMTDRSLYVLGKKKGTTTLTLFDDNKKLLGVFSVNVTHDLAQLKKKLYELAPNEDIQVSQNGDSIVLSGNASSSSVALMAAGLAEQHAPDAVMNAVNTNESQQVMLSVKIAEVQRTASKALGLATNATYNGTDGNLSFISGVLNPEAFVRGLGNHFEGDHSRYGLTLDALEDNGLLTTLAEPNLVAVSGETAYFLAGGEFPIPVGERSSETGGVEVRIEFKEFGVRLSYTPTVIGDTINLVIEPEVSTLDPANGIRLNAITIPGLITRRASTTVELKNGQSFAIAGLLQESFEDRIRQIPGIGSIPILGALARSSSYERKETELLIIVTPYIVEPYEGADYALPTDDARRPSDAELFILGQVEGGVTP